MMRWWREYLIYLLVRIALCVVQAVRIETCDHVARWLAILVTDVLGLRRGVVDENLQHAFAELTARERRDLTRDMWHHLILMACEIAHVPRKIHETNWRKYVSTRGVREVTTRLLDVRPTVLVSGHFGNFELACYMLGLLGMPTYAIARPLDNPHLDRYFQRLRRATGQSILPKQGSAEQVQRLLDDKGALALLGDQYAGPKGCWVEFFGRPASCHKAIALFSLTSDAPLLVTYAMRRDRPLQFEMGLMAVADPRQPTEQTSGVRSLTQWYSEQLEAIVRMAPAQYWWLHRRWKGSPPVGKRACPPDSANPVAA